jgi:hypothetical protein
MLQAGRGGGLESGWVLVGSWRAPKIMGARPHSFFLSFLYFISPKGGPTF